MSCDLQGHVVAEEQLQIPASWLEDIEYPAAQPPPKSSNSKNLEAKDGRNSIVVTNPDTGLRVEVRSRTIDAKQLIQTTPSS